VKKVFFLVGQCYIHAEPYSRLASMLRNAGTECRLYYIGESLKEFRGDLGFQSMIRKTNTRDMPIFCLNTKPGFINRPLQFIRLVLNKYILKYFLHREKPDLVVVGGDIANMNTRLFLDECERFGINVLMAPITDVNSGIIINPAANKGVPMAWLVCLALRCFSLEEVVFFKGWVLGSYHEQGVIAVPNKEIMQTLLDNGIQKERLVVVGKPFYDSIYDILQRSRDKIRSEVSSIVGFECTQDLRLVVYCTEVMQSIYSIEYVMNIDRLLYDAFNAFSDSVKVVIKFHPREPADVVALHKKALCGDRFYFVSSIDNYALLRAADVVISFWSTMLIDAALLKTPVLSIRLIDDKAPVIFDRTSEFTHITSEKEFQTKIWKMLFDRNFIDASAAVVSRWKDSVGIVIDGHSCERIAELIKVQISSGITEGID